jgi:hypothetical protein
MDGFPFHNQKRGLTSQLNATMAYRVGDEFSSASSAFCPFAPSAAPLKKWTGTMRRRRREQLSQISVNLVLIFTLCNAADLREEYLQSQQTAKMRKLPFCLDVMALMGLLGEGNKNLIISYFSIPFPFLSTSPTIFHYFPFPSSIHISHLAQ